MVNGRQMAGQAGRQNTSCFQTKQLYFRPAIFSLFWSDCFHLGFGNNQLGHVG
jgi:hypothetical protein